jgi:hypothetical protein
VSRKVKLPSSPPETSKMAPLSRMCETSVLDVFWWMRKGCCHIKVLACGWCEGLGRGQKTAWPSVPAVRSVRAERKTHCVRQEVKYGPWARVCHFEVGDVGLYV